MSAILEVLAVGLLLVGFWLAIAIPVAIVVFVLTNRMAQVMEGDYE